MKSFLLGSVVLAVALLALWLWTPDKPRGVLESPGVQPVLTLTRYVPSRPALRMNMQPAYAVRAALTDAMTARYRDLMPVPGSRDAMLASLQQTVLVDSLPQLRTIRAAALLVRGASDAMIPFADSADDLKAIPGSRLVGVPSTGHLPQEEAAAAPLASVIAFLR